MEARLRTVTIVVVLVMALAITALSAVFVTNARDLNRTLTLHPVPPPATLASSAPGLPDVGRTPIP